MGRMTKAEIKANELIIEAIEKLIEKYQKKAVKERSKVEQASVTYKGEKYCSESELMEAYACDVFSSSVYDRLVAKLDKAKAGISKNEMTESELIVFSLNQHKNNLLTELAHDKLAKERQAEIDARMRKLIEEGYSYREAETIIGNEELMRYE